MSRFLIILLFVLESSISYTQAKHHFSLGKDQFILDQKPFQIISGELHPARIPREYWRHRIQMTKAMGCNTIAAYVFWNYHEPVQGGFNFSSENRNIAEFIRICQQEKMWVLLRPGPYVCAEWDFGGLPPYLLSNPKLKIRDRNSFFMGAVETYIEKLSREIKELQVTKGGPILMVQIENEYGSFGNDRDYLEDLRRLWTKNGIDVPFYTADGPTDFMLEAGNIDGAAIGLDSGSSEADFERAKKRNSNVPAFSSETYPGWLTHWGEKWQRPDSINLKKEVEFLLKSKRSFNLYVVHGGTNFGFTAGANAFSPTQYQPDVTSYDYDAPIDEQGNPTAKYYMLRKLISQYVDYVIPDVPAPVTTIEIAPFQMKKRNSIWNNLQSPLSFTEPVPMEYFNQYKGMALYRTKLVGHKSGKLTIWEPHDYALVFLNNKFIDTVFRDGGKWTVDLPKMENSGEDPVLEILVEGMGHINFAQFMIDRKGITDRVTLNGMTLKNWQIFSLPMDYLMIQQHTRLIAGQLEKPGIFYTGEFELNMTGDTFLDLSGFSKGIVYINGNNLGRYWNMGPQQRLYCPASWLKKGKNQVILFDLHQLNDATVSGKKSME